ncbi:hypothetical protein [Mycobacterium sp.]|uniref:hypothetical protein n=1 Tax=Mycobacterium sp. TaxID=1785 RepID=UPI00242D8DE5|nr:hypothetical protein [Mycobacterium sp.]
MNMWIALAGFFVASVAAVVIGRIAASARSGRDNLAVGVGTVRTVVDEQPEAVGGERQIWIEVSSVHGDSFIGRLVHDDSETDMSTLRPGLVMLVAFDPAAREQLSLPDDVLAVRASGLELV